MPPQGFYGVNKPGRRKGKGKSGYKTVKTVRPQRESGWPNRPATTRPRPQIAPPAAPTAGTVNTATSQAAAAAYTGGTGAYNVGSDPAVAAAQGLAQKIRAQAQASALAKRKQAAIEYGDPTGVEGVDEATAKASRENPFSVLKNLEHANTTGTRDLEEGLNSANLFYSGYRGQQLGEAARGYQNSKYQAATGFKGLMTDINDRLAEALLNADSMEAGAIMGSDGGYYDSGGGGGGGGGGGDDGSYGNLGMTLPSSYKPPPLPTVKAGYKTALNRALAIKPPRLVTTRKATANRAGTPVKRLGGV